MSRPLALITGATAGLGAEFAQQLAQSGNDLILVARSVEALEAKAAELRASFGVNVEVLQADLLADSAVVRVSARLRQSEAPVDILVNNAGFGLVTAFEESTLAQEKDHLRLLVQTPMELSHAALEGMLSRGRGRIINVASVAGFIPRGSYGAAKAWIISFSRFANLRYKPRGVTVTAVCPGFVRTEFHQRMGASTAKIPKFMWLNAPRVVKESLDGAIAGKAVVIPSKRYKVLIAASRLVPDSIAAAAGNRGR